MKTKIFLLSLFFLLAFSKFACNAAYGIPATEIKAILDHPRDYQNKDITVHGTVTNAVSLVLIKYYEIQDETGSIKVVTDNLLPARGEKLSVTGRTTVVELGTERWVVLRENGDSTTQAVGSNMLGAHPRSSISGSTATNFNGSQAACLRNLVKPLTPQMFRPIQRPQINGAGPPSKHGTVRPGHSVKRVAETNSKIESAYLLHLGDFYKSSAIPYPISYVMPAMCCR